MFVTYGYGHRDSRSQKRYIVYSKRNIKNNFLLKQIKEIEWHLYKLNEMTDNDIDIMNAR